MGRRSSIAWSLTQQVDVVANSGADQPCYHCDTSLVEKHEHPRRLLHRATAAGHAEEYTAQTSTQQT